MGPTTLELRAGAVTDERGRGAEMSTPQTTKCVRRSRGMVDGSSPLPLLPLFSLLFAGCLAGNGENLRAREVAEVRAAFAENLAAIRRRDVEAYLAGYLDSPDFVYLGPDGVARGFAPFAEARQSQATFPDSLAAGLPEVTWLAPGVVHVAYPFAARQGMVTGVGWSERVFVRTTAGWRIAVTSVIPGVGDDGQ